MFLKGQQESPTTTTEGYTSSSFDTMSSNENPPLLALSDIMHPMSPSPVPVDDTPDSAPNRNISISQEPLTDLDISGIQRRLGEMGLVLPSILGNGQTQSLSINVDNTLSSREKELTDMILQLASCPRIDPAQLEEQAATIAILTTQRDILVAQAEEERLQWHFYREGWDRTAEALLTQKTRPLKTEELEAQRMAYESEIKILRDKLHDRHRRLSALEQEILRLKPLLLMQPYSGALLKQTLASQHQPTPKGRRREGDFTPSKVGTLRPIPEGDVDYHSSSPKKFVPSSYSYGYQQQPDESSSSILPSSSAPPQDSHLFLLEDPTPPNPSPLRRKSTSSNKHNKKQRQQKVASTYSDAYVEHILLAAQRIGRKRAAQVTGLQKLADREKDLLAREQEQMLTKKDQDRLEKERLERLANGTSSTTYYRPSTSASPQRGASRSGSTPSSLKTPKRGGYPTFGIGSTSTVNPGGVNTPTPSTYVFVNTSANPTPKSSVSVMNSPSNNLGLGSGMRSTHVNLSSNPPTPLDSLVDAARMMGESSNRLIGRRRPLEEPESPTAKRRRVLPDKSLQNRGHSRLGRVRSALDVLADQAAAVIEPIPETVEMPGGKGKSRAKGRDVQSDSSPTRSRGNAKSGRAPTRRRSKSPIAKVRSEFARTPPNRQTRSTLSGPRLIARPVVTPPFISPTAARVGPVVGWGNRLDLDAEGEDEDEENSDSQSTSILHDSYDCRQHTGPIEDSRMRNVDDLGRSHETSFAAKENLEQGNIAPQSVETPTHPNSGLAMNDGPPRESTAHTTLQELPDQEYARSQVPPQSPHTSRNRSQDHVPTTSPDQLLPADQHDNNEGADPDNGVQVEHDEDEDAEGEEEGTEGEAEGASRSPRSRSRSPPPPDPPPPGSDNGTGSDEGHDPDADAEGEMDVDDSGTPSGSAVISSVHQSRALHLKDVLCFLEILHSSLRAGPTSLCHLMPAICSMLQLLTLSNHCFPFVSTLSRCLTSSCNLLRHSCQFEEGLESRRSGLTEGDRNISCAENCQSNIGNSSNESCRQLASSRPTMKYLECPNYGNIVPFLTPSDSLLVACLAA